MQHNEFERETELGEKKSFPPLFTVTNSISLLVSLLFFVVLVFFCKLVLPGASFIELTLQTDHEDTIQIFCSNGQNEFVPNCQSRRLQQMDERTPGQKSHSNRP